MVKTEVLVKLAAPDPWSFTVLDTLTRKFGFEDIIAVERTKSWELTFDLVSPDAAVAQTKELLRTTALLANPNRDVWAVRCGPGDLPEGFWYSDTDEAGAFVVLVTDTDDIVAGKRRGIEAADRVAAGSLRWHRSEHAVHERDDVQVPANVTISFRCNERGHPQGRDALEVISLVTG